MIEKPGEVGPTPYLKIVSVQFESIGFVFWPAWRIIVCQNENEALAWNESLSENLVVAEL
jgi:hypothetical protein